MIDIIIPAYNAHKTIFRTLASISIQTIKNIVNVYIVDDCSQKNYHDIANFFKNTLNIIELKTEKKMGPGYARQFALDRSFSEYIVFIDADDELYNCNSLELLYNEISTNNLDLVIGLELIENNSIRSSDGTLHGKIYRRNHIYNNKIQFNNTFYSEDNSFHKLVLNTTNKIKIIDKLTYVYIDNKRSITNNINKKVEILDGFTYNMVWLATELEKRNINREKIIKIIIQSYLYLYKEISNDKKTNYSLLYNLPYNFETYLKKYRKEINNQVLLYNISIFFGLNSIYNKCILNDFNNFRKHFTIEEVIK